MKGKVKITVSKKSEAKNRKKGRLGREAFYNHLESSRGKGIYLEAGLSGCIDFMLGSC